MNEPVAHRALVLSRSCPYPIDRAVGGIHKRLKMLLQAAALQADLLDCVFFVPSQWQPTEAMALEVAEQLAATWGVKTEVRLVAWADWTEFGPASPMPVLSARFQRDIRRLMGPQQLTAVREALMRRPSWILAHRLQPMVALQAAGEPLPPVIFDLDDIEHLSLWRSLRAGLRWRSEATKYLHIPALWAAERRAIKLSRLTLVCSDPDVRRVTEITRDARPFAAANPVSVPPLRDGQAPGPNLAFVGSYSFRPNADAAHRLIAEVFPLIRRAVPEARLEIIGEAPEQIPSFNAQPEGVHFRGFAPSMADAYLDVRLLCCPIRIGSGTRLKIIEAASFGVPTVSTSLGAEGLLFSSPGEIRISDTNGGLASACVELLRDPAQATKVGQAAWLRAKREYDLGHLVEGLAAEIDKALVRPPSPSERRSGA